MITLLTAVPGSGKTLTAVQLIFKANEAGRAVYHNIDGLRSELFPSPNLIFDAPADWRDTPDGSLVVYDECQQPNLYPATAKAGRVDDDRLTAMEVHRHTGHDLVFITQAPTLVHHHVRKLCGEHIHLYRARGVGGAMRYEWSHCCDKPNDRAEQQRANSYFWRFPKEFYKYYQSATVHTHKFKIPAKLAIFLGFFAVAVIYFGWRFYNFSGVDVVSLPVDSSSVIESGLSVSSSPAVSSSVPAASSVPIVSGPYAWTRSVQESVPLGGCIASSDEKRCQCYSPEGVTLDMSVARCLVVMSQPLPRRIVLGSGAGGGSGSEVDSAK